MKNSLIALMVIFLIPVLVNSQDLIAISKDKDVTTDGRIDCVKTIFSIPVPYLRSDCPDANQADVDITFRFYDCFGIILGNFCNFSHSVIELNGVEIKRTDFGETVTNYNETITSSQYSNLINDAVEACFTIRVFKECTLTGISEIYSSTKCIPVLKEGDTFEKIRYGSPVITKQLECIAEQSITVCCNDPSVTISSEIGLEVSSSQSNSLDIILGNFTAGGTSFEMDSPFNYTSTTNLTTSISTNTTVLRELTIKPEPGTCKSVAININLLTEYKDYYSVGDCNDEPFSYLSAILGESVYSITLTECNLFLCTQGKPALVFSKKLPKYIRDGCTGTILADIPSDYEGGLSFSWSGPLGFTSNTQDIEDVIFGTYTLIVTDDCCNEYEYSYFLCDDIEYGPWEKSEEELIFCRSLVCNSENCEVENSQECVEPDEVIESFENGTCIEKYYYMGDFLGEVLSIADVKIEYNESTQQCIKIANCKNDKFIIEQGPPTYGLWKFNYASEECNRSIYCFNQEVQNILDVKNPIIEESFDLITGLCNRTAFCATGVPIILAPKPPLIAHQWQWLEFQGCTKYVQCSNESGSETVVGQENFNNWTFNSNVNMCESDVTCENSWIPGATHTEFPSSIGLWNWSSARPIQEQCYRTILCGTSSYIEDTAQPTYQTTGVPCGDGLFQYYIICGGTNTFETGCGSFQSETIDNETRASNTPILGDNINVFPNPFSSNISIRGLNKAKDYNVEIQNLSGQIIHKEVLQNGALELSHLPSGVYILKLKNNKESILIKKISKY